LSPIVQLICDAETILPTYAPVWQAIHPAILWKLSPFSRFAVNGLRLSQVPVTLFIWLGAYLGLVNALLITAWRQLDHFSQSQGSVSLVPSKMSYFDCSSCRPETALWLFHHYIRCSSLLALLSVLLSNSLGWPSRSPEHRGSSHGLGTQACCLCGGRAFSPQPRDTFGTFRFAECNAAPRTDKTVCVLFMRPIGRALAEIFEYFLLRRYSIRAAGQLARIRAS
jgi:hypothetical protein